MTRIFMMIAALSASTSLPAAAQPADSGVAGTYGANFDEVANNCEGIGMTLREAPIVIRERGGGKVEIVVAGRAPLAGELGKGGKVRAVGREQVPGSPAAEARLAISGRVDARGLQMVFIAEYYSGDKPRCTQSWAVSGKRR